MQALQQRLQQRVIPCLNSQLQERAGVLGDEPVQLAQDLWAAALSVAQPAASGPDPEGIDVVVPEDVLSTIAYLHWCRYQVKPEGEDRDDLQAAAGMFARLYPTKPDQVPERFTRLASTDEHRFIDDNAGHLALMGESYIGRMYPVDVPKVRVGSDLPVDVTSDLDLDPSDPRTMVMLNEAYQLSFHVTSARPARDMYGAMGTLKHHLRPASAFHFLAAAAGDVTKPCIMQATECDGQTTLSVVYTGEGDPGTESVRWMHQTVMDPLDEVARSAQTELKIGAPRGMKASWPRMRVVPLGAYLA